MSDSRDSDADSSAMPLTQPPNPEARQPCCETTHASSLPSLESLKCVSSSHCAMTSKPRQGLK